jgi:hypothetical protein
MILQPQFRVASRLHIFVAYGCKRVSRLRLDPGEQVRLRTVSFTEFLRIANRPDFRHASITLETFRARLDPRKMRALKKRILGRSRSRMIY